jgi:hypothetical protein
VRNIEHGSSQNANSYAVTIITTDHLVLGLLQRTEIRVRTAESAVRSREKTNPHLEGNSMLHVHSDAALAGDIINWLVNYLFTYLIN